MERKDRPEYKILKLRLPLLHLLEMSITNFYNAAYKCDLDIINRSLSIIFTSCIIFSFVSGRSDSYKSLFTKNLIYTVLGLPRTYIHTRVWCARNKLRSYRVSYQMPLKRYVYTHTHTDVFTKRQYVYPWRTNFNVEISVGHCRRKRPFDYDLISNG